jgi:hypothetical protein
MGNRSYEKPLLRSLNTISFVLIIFTLQLIQSIRVMCFFHKSYCGAGGLGNGTVLRVSTMAPMVPARCCSDAPFLDSGDRIWLPIE